MPPRRNPEPRPRGAYLPTALAVLALAALLWSGRAELPEHLARWFGDGRARIALDLARLSPGLDAAALAQLLGGLPLPCQGSADGQVCSAALVQADDLPAAHLVATWRQARLQAVDITVPWWAHHGAARWLSARLGPPTGADAATPDDEDATPGIRWKLAQGTVQIARAPGWNPWAWSTLRWRAPGTPAR
ncbi:hypothetical protein [Pseudorhodoferax sp.]|uniref:hypothetical protein n=1 Tax=Pseudorhodoferax sp. TaxID=1993553 RepID=UPI002DD638D3|nr:hypothetical protein [Pseudorhodoferax sp.]